MTKIEEIRKRLDQSENLVKKAKILYDGKQFMIKIPKEISDFLKIQKNKSIFVFDIQIPPEPDKPITQKFRIDKYEKRS